MAVHPFRPTPNNPSIAATDSDYGSDIDIDDDTAETLFSQVRSQSLSPLNDAEKEAVLPSIETQASFIAELEEDVFTHNFSVRLAKLRQSLDGVEESRARLEEVVQRRRREATVEVEYDERNRRAFSREFSLRFVGGSAVGRLTANGQRLAASNLGHEPLQSPVSTVKTMTAKKEEKRSPLQRFKARRPLSVTNLVSPSWCEQQYEYNLSHHGRIPQTKAMSAGTTAHKELEEQVHVEVPVEVVSREDRFGLKLWNTIQGLRALRETGLTRELEVWSVLEGEVVNGIIDEVTVDCPDAEMEARMLNQLEGGESGVGKKGKKEPQLAPDQRTLTDFLTNSQGGSILERTTTSSSALPTSLRDRPTTTYYLKDIKTTRRDRPPANTAYTRGAHIQLMLYHRILSTLAANEVSSQQVFARYGLDAMATFSDKFIAELANLDMRAFVSVPDDADLPPSSQEWQRDPLTELLERNTLEKLWRLLVEEAQRTFPPQTTTAASADNSAAPYSALSPLLTLEYRNPAPSSPAPSSTSSSLIGRRSFPLDPNLIADYLRSEISWWRGERATVGVSVEDAWKCGWCEFAEVCVWRKERVEEGVERARLRREGFGRSGV